MLALNACLAETEKPMNPNQAESGASKAEESQSADRRCLFGSASDPPYLCGLRQILKIH